MAIRIRDAVPADLPDLQSVFRRSVLSNEGDRELMAAHPEFLEFSLPHQSAGRSRVAVADDGRIAGFATGLAPQAGAVELEDLFVDPEWMRRGVGSALVRDLEAIARAQGCRRVEVTANAHAMDFYRRVGFVEVGQAETAAGPAARMHLSVAPPPPAGRPGSE